MALLYGLRSHGFLGKIAVAMQTPTDADLLRRHGADVLLTPFSDAVQFAVSAIEHVLDEPQSALSSG